MSSLTPHRDAVEAALAQHAGSMSALPPPDCEMERMNREMSTLVVPAVMRTLADSQDRGLDPKEYLRALTMTLGNALASACGTLANEKPDAPGMLVGALAIEIHRRALSTLYGPSEVATLHRYDADEAGRA